MPAARRRASCAFFCSPMTAATGVSSGRVPSADEEGPQVHLARHQGGGAVVERGERRRW